MFWLLLFVAAGILAAYKRLSLKRTMVLYGALLAVYLVFGASSWVLVLLLLLYVAVFVPLAVTALRQEWITRPALDFFRGVLPAISDTERAALEAGTVWWDGELFSGHPDLQRLVALPVPALSPEEQAFLDGPVDQFCRMLDEWRITHHDQDISKEAWAFLKEHRFFGMIIPKRYGGLEFSAFAHSQVLVKVASSPGGATAASIVAVPNSLGPAELLLLYGTEEQKNHYLPRLATGDEIPCFGLTSPWAGSDAAAIPDTGVVCKGLWKGKEVLGLRLSFDKRYITLAPVATVVGLAFRMFDPEKLLGDREDLGITCALIPRDTPGLEIGARHLPMNQPFMNGPLRASDMFVPLDFIIGGPDQAGQGWRMLMECLSVGRAISLPSNATGTALAAAYCASAYARVRRQFGLPIGQFEGVQEAVAKAAARAYACDAVRAFTAHAVDLGERPSVPSAIAKLHCTEMAQEAAKLSMDVHAGKGVMLGPRNWIGRNFQSTPIAITVEGANILTRSLIVFGQGAIRCHPYVLKEIEAVAEPNRAQALQDFDEAFLGHIGHVLTAAARSLVLGLSLGRLASAPVRGPVRRHYQQLQRYSAALALLSDATMALLGGQLKFRESISGRLGDVLSRLYIASAALRRFENDSHPPEDLELVHWVCDDCWQATEAALDGVLRHLPSRPLRWLLRPLIFPLGRQARPPRDEITIAAAQRVQEPGPARERLFAACFAPHESEFAFGLLRSALQRVVDCEPLERRLQKAVREGVVKALHPLQRIAEAERGSVLTSDEAAQLRACYELVDEVCRVDEFTAAELGPARAGRRRKAAVKEE